MSEKEIVNIAENADIIVNGFSFTADEQGLVHVLNLNNPDEACLLNKDGEMVETSMEDEVLFKVQAYYAQNRELMEDA